MKFANRMDRFGEGVFSMLAQMKKKKLEEGEMIVDLSIGAPNIAPAPHILKALSEACLVPENYLYAIQDQQALLEAVSDWYARRYGVKLNPETEICSLLGPRRTGAHRTFDRGRGRCGFGTGSVLSGVCGWSVFGGGRALLYAAAGRKSYIIDLKEIPEEVAQKAKFMIVSYPNNPTAVLAPDSFYEELIAFAKKYDIIVLHDNAYSELVFDGRTCRSFLRFPGAREVGVEFNSLSKTYGLAGARVGFCVGNKEVVSHLKTLKSNMDYGMFLPIQKAAIAAITGDQSCVASTRAAYERRRDCLCDGLASIGWKMEKPEGTMFVWAPIPAGFSDSMEFVKTLFRKTGVW